ncbi:MAG: hypothetical protein K0S92_1309, partial [Desertimonas sp.]|nr:hypothetical protein [Desertimonas sp.]
PDAMRSTTNLVTSELGRSFDAGCGYTLLRQATLMIDFPNRRWSAAPT